MSVPPAFSISFIAAKITQRIIIGNGEMWPAIIQTSRLIEGTKKIYAVTVGLSAIFISYPQA
jgi:hypothetical protein